MNKRFFEKITIIGAGNMGSAIAGGLLQYSDSQICLANRSEIRLNKTKEVILASVTEKTDNLRVTNNIAESVSDASLIIIAVKPWAVKEVLGSIKSCLDKQAIILSVAAGINLDELSDMTGGWNGGGFVRMIPNTAVRIGKGMSFACSEGVSKTTLEALGDLFAPITKLSFIDESKMDAATALCSCGIAYVYKFIAAAAQAGVELGFSYDDSVEFFNATVGGASAMIDRSDMTLQEHINAVTTPGGMTIRGVNELERQGFTAAVIDSILKPLKK